MIKYREYGEVSEWLKEHAWKACKVARPSQVRILFSPPSSRNTTRRVVFLSLREQDESPRFAQCPVELARRRRIVYILFSPPSSRNTTRRVVFLFNLALSWLWKICYYVSISTSGEEKDESAR